MKNVMLILIFCFVSSCIQSNHLSDKDDVDFFSAADVKASIPSFSDSVELMML